MEVLKKHDTMLTFNGLVNAYTCDNLISCHVITTR